MEAKFKCLYTKEQLVWMFKDDDFKFVPPKKGEKVYINRPLNDGGLTTIEKSEQKSTYGQALYLLSTCFM